MFNADHHHQTYVIVAPSGGGKSSLIFSLLNRHHNLALAVSHTTRRARAKEKEGQHYYFSSIDHFKSLINQGAFLEWAEVHKDFYGTTKQEIYRIHQSEKKAVCDIDIQGLIQVKKIMPIVPALFVLPPSFKEMKRRLLQRNSETEESLKRRYSSALKELSLMHHSDFFLVNEDFDLSRKIVEDWMVFGRCPPNQKEEALKLADDLILELTQAVEQPDEV
ncbi:MAG: guanylate kinase [Proteobacteria bacterium]|nr:guanylate kinase [Pseudomonadota bacterium]